MRKSTAQTPSVNTTVNKKKRGDSPDKSSPIASAEIADSKRNDVIWDEALENLRIKEHDISDIDSVQEAIGSFSRHVMNVNVKRRKIIAEEAFVKVPVNLDEQMSHRTKVAVIKVAPENAKVKEFCIHNGSMENKIAFGKSTMPV